MTPNPQNLPLTTLPGQRSSPGGGYLYGFRPLFVNPGWLSADIWRGFVRTVPVATLCRQTAISHLTALDWKVVARDSNQTDELKSEILYYSKILENSGDFDGLDFTGRLEWGGRDILDLPFGMAAEIGRENDDPNGKVVWIRMLDGGTLMPSLNADYPVIQQFSNLIIDPVAFPRHAISRQYLNPQSDIRLEGWGMAPPELIYLVFELMKRGDLYYSKLLLDTPQIGILDLGDTTKETAQEWMKEAQDLFVGTDPMKIPVLYEHTTAVKWIPFQMTPNEIMFESITARYAGLICAGYGMSLSDIGMGGGKNGGETLSGTIRDERKEKRTIQSVLKKKWKSFYNHILPDTLEFVWIDFDDDANVARGRARLANAQADEIFTRNQIFEPDELRAQAVVDGLITVSVPEKLDRKSVEWPKSGNTTNPGLIGEKVSAQNGGRGEVSSVQASLIKPVIQKAYQSIKTLAQNSTPELWKSLDDCLWWKSEVNEDVEKLRKSVIYALKKRNIATVEFNQEDAPQVLSVLKEKAILDYSNQAELNEHEVSELELETIENNVLGIEVMPMLTKSSEEATEIARSIVATTILSEMLQKFSLDPNVKESDNKARTVAEVEKKFSEVYPSLMIAAETAGQQILEKYLDEGAKNVKDS